VDRGNDACGFRQALADQHQRMLGRFNLLTNKT
jgi:hypothetical protein